MADCNKYGIPVGLNGYNAFTSLTTAFTIPAEGSTATAYVRNQRPYTGLWANVGQNINIGGNTFEVVTGGSASLVVKNLANVGNDVAGTILPIGSGVSPDGSQGPQGLPVNNNAGVIYFKANNTIESDSYTELDSIDIAYLINNNDCIEIQSVVRYQNSLDCTLGGYKFQVNATDTHEYTSAELFDATDLKYVIHKATITRVSNILLNINSVIYVTDSSGSLNSLANNQSFIFTSPAALDTSDINIRFLLRNNVPDFPVTQVVLQVKYLPTI